MQNKLPRIEKICKYCGISFITPLNKSGISKRIYCSRSCSVSTRNREREWKLDSKEKIRKHRIENYRGLGNPNYRGGGTKCVCQECNKEFIIETNQLKNGKRKGRFCSKDCNTIYLQKYRKPIIQKKLTERISGVISYTIRHKQKKSNSIIFKILGFTLQELKVHLEKQFKEGMTWENHNKYGWHIDHIKPVSMFKYSSENDEQFKECWKLSNLQPLWWKDNLSKGGSNRKQNVEKYG